MKAIIPAAGLGTRFLPGTKCTPKEMLPVLDKPVIQYVVEEALDPEEVDDAIIVTSPGKPELLSYFQPDRSLENLLRERGKDAYAMTITLLMNSEGKKMGKTASGAVWLDPEKTSPYEFYQYWRNVGDQDVLKCIRMLTFLPLEEIDAMDHWEGAQLNEAKDILAFELTKLVHGEEEAAKAREASKALFGGGANLDNMPTTTLSDADFTDGKIDILDILLKTNITKSRGEGRRLVQQGGVSVDDKKVADIGLSFTSDDLKANAIIVKKGKKIFHKVQA